MNKKISFLSFLALLALGVEVLAPSGAFGAESLSIQKILFADEVIGLGQYTPRPDSRFTLDDVCRVYVEAAGFAMPPTPGTEDSYDVNLAVDVLIKLPQSGRKIAAQSDMATLTTPMRSKLSAQAIPLAFTFDGWSPGNYVMEVGLRDILGGQTVSRDLALQLVEPTEADIKARQEREAQEAARESAEQDPPAPQ